LREGAKAISSDRANPFPVSSLGIVENNVGLQRLILQIYPGILLLILIAL
jgi:hypothetical protein